MNIAREPIWPINEHERPHFDIEQDINMNELQQVKVFKNGPIKMPECRNSSKVP